MEEIVRRMLKWEDGYGVWCRVMILTMVAREGISRKSWNKDLISYVLIGLCSSLFVIPHLSLLKLYT